MEIRKYNFINFDSKFINEFMNYHNEIIKSPSIYD